MESPLGQGLCQTQGVVETSLGTTQEYQGLSCSDACDLMRELTHGELFAGISGFGLGFERSGIKTIWRVEKDRFSQKLLNAKYPDDKLLGDVKDCGKNNLEPVDIISFGSPCQDLSVAGRGVGWVVRKAVSSSRRYASYVNSTLLLQSGRMFPALFPVTLDEILQQSSPSFANAGRVTSRGECLTLGISESPKDAVESSLSQILEESVPRKYFLSPRACQGVLRRSEKRGKELPPQLKQALQAVVTEGAIRPRKNS